MATGKSAAELPAELYDATGAVRLHFFGEHVHVGNYKDLKADLSNKSWRQAQHDHVQEILAFAGIKHADKLLDVGCGYGGTAASIVEKLPGCSAVGINISSFQVEAGNKLAARKGFKPQQLHFLVADGMAPPFPDAAFDVVLSVESSTYMPDRNKFISEQARLCAPGGKVVLVDFHKGPHATKGPEEANILKKMYSMFATQEWATPEGHMTLMAKHGLKVERYADWTAHVRGFWSVGLFELAKLWAEEKEGATFAQHMHVIKKLLVLCWLVLIGGIATFKMAWLWITGIQKRVAVKGMRTGAFGYYIIVAQKPMDWAAAGSNGAAALPGGNDVQVVVDRST